jgi:predicted MFS family arabinose efflux permease
LIIVLMIGNFSIFPYASPYLVSNVGLTEQQLPLIYIVGGALTLIAAPIVGRLADRYGKLRVYLLIAPISGVLMVVQTRLPPVNVWVAVAVCSGMMVSNVGRMIAAMAMATSSVTQKRRGAFLTANSSVQHVAGGVGAYVGGLIISEGPGGRIEHYGTVGLVGAGATAISLWLATRVRAAKDHEVSAESISMAAAAEAAVDVGEPLLGAAQETPEE